MASFENVIGRLYLARAKVKAIDPTALDQQRRGRRTGQMRALRRAIDELVRIRFERLSGGGRPNVLRLDQVTLDLSTALSGIQTAVGVLDTIDAALESIVSLVQSIRDA